MRHPGGAKAMLNHSRAEGAQSQGGADGLASQGRVMDLAAYSEARGSVSQSVAGEVETRGRPAE